MIHSRMNGAGTKVGRRQGKRRDPLSTFFLVIAVIVFFVFMAGVVGVIMFLNQDYEQALKSSRNAKKKLSPAVSLDREYAMVLENRGCCNKHTLSCVACKKGISTKQLCLLQPAEFEKDCPTIQSIALGGNGELIRAKYGKILDAAHLTVSAWVRVSLGQQQFGTIVSNRMDACTEPVDDKERIVQFGYSLKVSEYGQLILTVGGSERPCITFETARDTIRRDEWVHVGFTLDDKPHEISGFSASLFANGVELVTFRGGEHRPLPRYKSSRNVFHVGSCSDGLSPFIGHISNVQVFHGAFRSALIWPSPRRPVAIGDVPQVIAPFLLLHYNFSALVLADGTLSADIKDLSGTGRDGIFLSSRQAEATLQQDRKDFEVSALSMISTSTSPNYKHVSEQDEEEAALMRQKEKKMPDKPSVLDDAKLSKPPTDGKTTLQVAEQRTEQETQGDEKPITSNDQATDVTREVTLVDGQKEEVVKKDHIVQVSEASGDEELQSEKVVEEEQEEVSGEGGDKEFQSEKVAGKEVNAAVGQVISEMQNANTKQEEIVAQVGKEVVQQNEEEPQENPSDAAGLVQKTEEAEEPVQQGEEENKDSQRGENLRGSHVADETEDKAKQVEEDSHLEVVQEG